MICVVELKLEHEHMNRGAPNCIYLPSATLRILPNLLRTNVERPHQLVGGEGGMFDPVNHCHYCTLHSIPYIPCEYS